MTMMKKVAVDVAVAVAVVVVGTGTGPRQALKSERETQWRRRIQRIARACAIEE